MMTPEKVQKCKGKIFSTSDLQLLFCRTFQHILLRYSLLTMKLKSNFLSVLLAFSNIMQEPSFVATLLIYIVFLPVTALIEKRVKEENPLASESEVRSRVNSATYHLGQKIQSVRKSFKAKGLPIPTAEEAAEKVKAQRKQAYKKTKKEKETKKDLNE